jgi:hypothetical protein
LVYFSQFLVHCVTKNLATVIGSGLNGWNRFLESRQTAIGWFWTVFGSREESIATGANPTIFVSKNLQRHEIPGAFWRLFFPLL